MPDVWQLIEDAPDYADDVGDLYHWSTNFDAGTGPFTLFLDLVGWSEDELGEMMYDLKSANLGYLELDKLGAALRQYADRPTDVRSFVDELMQAESNDE